MALAYEIGRLLGTEIETETEMSAAITNEELPASALIRLVEMLAGTDRPREMTAVARRIVSRATWQRALKNRDAGLSAAMADRTERIAALYAQAERVWGDADDARAFLLSEQGNIGGAPLDLAAESTVGGRQVSDLLIRIDHGVAV